MPWKRDGDGGGDWVVGGRRAPWPPTMVEAGLEPQWQQQQ